MQRGASFRSLEEAEAFCEAAARQSGSELGSCRRKTSRGTTRVSRLKRNGSGALEYPGVGGYRSALAWTTSDAPKVSGQHRNEVWALQAAGAGR
jgi:hypothetical protein